MSGRAAVADDVVIVSCISETPTKTTSCVDSVREEEDDGKVFLRLEVLLTRLLMCLKCFFLSLQQAFVCFPRPFRDKQLRMVQLPRGGGQLPAPGSSSSVVFSYGS